MEGFPDGNDHRTFPRSRRPVEVGRPGRSPDFRARRRFRRHLLAAPSRPDRAGAMVRHAAFVPGHSSGAVPDSHRIPDSAACIRQAATSDHRKSRTAPRRPRQPRNPNRRRPGARHRSTALRAGPELASPADTVARIAPARFLPSAPQACTPIPNSARAPRTFRRAARSW